MKGYKILAFSSCLLLCTVFANAAKMVDTKKTKVPGVTNHESYRKKMDTSRPKRSVLGVKLIEGNLKGMMRFQSANMAEMSISARPQAEVECFKTYMCYAGAVNDETKHPTISALRQFVQILELMSLDIEENPDLHIKDYPYLHQLLGSYQVGKSTGDGELCDKLFACAAPSAAERRIQLLGPKAYPIAPAQGRTSCGGVSAICPGVAIGCSVCGLYAPGLCGDQCIIAGLYCGTSAVACASD